MKPLQRRVYNFSHTVELVFRIQCYDWRVMNIVQIDCETIYDLLSLSIDTFDKKISTSNRRTPRQISTSIIA